MRWSKASCAPSNTSEFPTARTCARCAGAAGGYDNAELSALLTGDDMRLTKVIQAVREIVLNPTEMRALGFCVSVEHAKYMAS